MTKNTKKSRSWAKPLIIGAVAFSTLAGASLTTAQARGWGDGDRHGGYSQMHKDGQRGDGPMRFSKDRLDRFFTMIDATDEQKEKLTAIFDKAQDDMKALRDTRDDNRKAMRDQITELLKAPEFDRQAAKDLIDSRDEMRGGGKDIVETALLDAVEVLTPDQRSKVADFVGDRGGFLFGGFGHGRGPRN